MHKTLTGTLPFFDPDRPDTWPLQFFDRGRLQGWPEHLLERVARHLATTREETVEAALVKLLVTEGWERRVETDELPIWRTTSEPRRARRITLHDKGQGENARRLAVAPESASS